MGSPGKMSAQGCNTRLWGAWLSEPLNDWKEMFARILKLPYPETEESGAYYTCPLARCPRPPRHTHAGPPPDSHGQPWFCSLCSTRSPPRALSLHPSPLMPRPPASPRLTTTAPKVSFLSGPESSPLPAQTPTMAACGSAHKPPPRSDSVCSGGPMTPSFALKLGPAAPNRKTNV